MENHHFNMGMMILQQESNNIFENLNYKEYNEVLQTMKACILATDLALFFPNKAKLANIVKENSFDWQEPEHRRLAMALCMTGSDLNSSSKPWETQFRTSKLVYSEFHEQVKHLKHCQSSKIAKPREMSKSCWVGNQFLCLTETIILRLLQCRSELPKMPHVQVLLITAGWILWWHLYPML